MNFFLMWQKLSFNPIMKLFTFYPAAFTDIICRTSRTTTTLRNELCLKNNLLIKFKPATDRFRPVGTHQYGIGTNPGPWDY
jgi:hypothetical protein